MLRSISFLIASTFTPKSKIFALPRAPQRWFCLPYPYRYRRSGDSDTHQQWAVPLRTELKMATSSKSLLHPFCVQRRIGWLMYARVKPVLRFATIYARSTSTNRQNSANNCWLKFGFCSSQSRITWEFSRKITQRIERQLARRIAYRYWYRQTHGGIGCAPHFRLGRKWFTVDSIPASRRREGQ